MSSVIDDLRYMPFQFERPYAVPKEPPADAKSLLVHGLDVLAMCVEPLAPVQEPG